MGDYCSNGHEMTPENTYVNAGRRRCRTCVKEDKRQWCEDQKTERCEYVYPTPWRNAGQQCTAMIRKNNSGRCREHQSCGVSRSGKVTQIVLEKAMNTWD